MYNVTNTNRVFTQSFTGTVSDDLNISVTIAKRCAVRLNEGKGRAITNIKIKSGTTTLTGTANTTFYAYAGETISATESYKTGYSTTNTSTATPAAGILTKIISDAYTYDQADAPYFWWKLAKRNSYTLSCTLNIEGEEYTMSGNSTQTF